MFDIDVFIDGCESLKINDWDCNWSIATEGILDFFSKGFQIIIKALKKFGIWLKGLLGRYGENYYYAGGMEKIVSNYEGIVKDMTNIIGDKLSKMKPMMIGNQEIYTDNYTSLAVNVDKVRKVVDDANSEIFLAVEKDVEGAIPPKKLLSSKTFIVAMNATLDELEKQLILKEKEISSHIGDNENAPKTNFKQAATQSINNMANMVAIIQSGFSDALAKCQYKGRKNKQPAYVNVEFD